LIDSLELIQSRDTQRERNRLMIVFCISITFAKITFYFGLFVRSN